MSNLQKHYAQGKKTIPVHTRKERKQYTEVIVVEEVGAVDYLKGKWKERKNQNCHEHSNVTQKGVVFKMGQKVQAKDGNRWYNAMVKDVYFDRIKVGWLYNQWASEKYDQYFKKSEWDTNIRDPKTKLPYSMAPVYAYQSKHIVMWTYLELREWICSLNLGTRQEKKIVDAITKQEFSGTEFNSMSNQSDMINLFEITHDCAQKVLRELVKVRGYSISDNVSGKANNNLQIDSMGKEYILLQGKFNELLQQHSFLTKEIVNKEKNTSQLQQHNLTLLEANTSITKQTIDQEKKYNLLLKKYNEVRRENSCLKQGMIQKDRDYNALRNKNNELTKQKSDLNEECKGLKMELNDIKDKYNKWVTQNSDYKTWDYNIITDWIIGLDKQFIEYENELREKLKKEEITGADLIDLDKNDLNRFGIRVFKHKKRIIQEIQKLAFEQNNNIPNYEGQKESVYIEQ